MASEKIGKIKDSYKAGTEALRTYVDIFQHLADAQEKLAGMAPNMISKDVGQNIMTAFSSVQHLVSKFGKAVFGDQPGVGMEEDGPQIDEPMEEVEPDVEPAKNIDGQEFEEYGSDNEQAVGGEFNDSDLEEVSDNQEQGY